MLLGAAVLAGGLTSTPQTGEPAPSLLLAQPFLPPTMSESGTSLGARAERVEVFADRHVYFADDGNGQFLVTFLGKVRPEDAAALRIHLSLRDPKTARVLESRTVTPVLGPKLPFLIPTLLLRPGRYELAAALEDATGKVLAQAARQFERSTQTAPRVAFPPQGIPIHVHRQAHVPDGEWPISTGVPMPKGTLKDPRELSLLENGKAVPAQFVTRATWSPRGDVKWVGVDFIARYDKGEPREYRLLRQPGHPAPTPARPLQVRASAENILVDTGIIQFVIGRQRFAGIEKAWVDGNGDGAYSDEEAILNGGTGSFVIDDQGRRFDSAHSKDVQVVVEESGPLQATIAAKGWYTSESGDRLCKFVIRFKAYVGRPFVMVSHRTINTIPDQYVSTRLADVGFETVPNRAVQRWRYGFDGRSQAGNVGKAASIFLHQNRGDHFRLMQDERMLAEGKRSDGWMSADMPNGAVTYFLRDVYQKFPRELELEVPPEAGRTKLVAHLWPKHGGRAFLEEEEIAPDQIYKVRYAHQGRLLEFRIPASYHEQLQRFEKQEPWAGADGQLAIVDRERNLTAMQAASGQGTVVGGDLVIRFDAKPLAPDALRAEAGLIQQSPHGLADPKWNCDTGVLGPLAARDPTKFGLAEKLLDRAYSFYRHAIIEEGDEYGAWIYGGVHSDWRPEKNRPSLTRVWQQSHYQNVFQAWLLYFRSGLPEHFEWARIHSSQHLDVGVCNYLAYPEGKHRYARLGDLGGGIYHCKGFMPWAGGLSTDGHWIDVANYFLGYYLTGDRRGLDLAEAWMENRNKMVSSNTLGLPTSCEGYQDPKKLAAGDAYLGAHPGVSPAAYPPWIREEKAKPPRFNPREVLVPLGEMVQYYEATWNPQALISIENLSNHLNVEFECTSSPELAAFGKHWQDWYYGLTRDPRVIERIRNLLGFLGPRVRSPDYVGLSAFLYHTTGDATFLKRSVSVAYGEILDVYDCAGDRYDGFCLVQSNPAAMILGRLPYLLHAMDAAGLPFAGSDADTAVPTRGGRTDVADKWPSRPRGWSNTGVTVLARALKPSRIAVSIDGPRSYGDLRGFYQLFSGFPDLALFRRRDADAWIKEQQVTSLVRFESPNLLKDPPEYRNYAVKSGEIVQTFPYLERASNDPSQRQYRLEHGGSHLNLPVFLDADTKDALPQAAVIARTVYLNGQVQEASSSSKGVMDVYFRPLDARAVIQLVVDSVHVRYWMPTKVRITDARGAVVLDSSVFMAGQRTQVSATLDPSRNPLPWRMLMASWGDNRIHFTGAEELLFARRPEEFDQLLPYLPFPKE